MHAISSFGKEGISNFLVKNALSCDWVSACGTHTGEHALTDTHMNMRLHVSLQSHTRKLSGTDVRHVQAHTHTQEHVRTLALFFCQ